MVVVLALALALLGSFISVCQASYACPGCLDLRAVAQASGNNNASQSQELASRLYSAVQPLQSLTLPCNVYLDGSWSVNTNVLATGALAVQAARAPPTLVFGSGARITSTGEPGLPGIFLSVERRTSPRVV